VIEARITLPRAALAAAMCAAWLPPAAALDLSWQPQLRVGTRATDNVLWSSTNQEAALGFDNGGGMIVKAEAQDWRSTLTPSFNFRRYAIGENLDADEYGARTQHQWFVTDRVQLGANLDYVRDSTNSTELTDAGNRNQIANRDTYLAQPSITFLVDDRTSVNGSYVYQDVSFDTSANGQLVDFSFEQFTVGGTHLLTDDVRLFATAFASQFETPDTNGKTRTYGGQAGAGYQFTEDFSVEGAVGYVSSDIEFETSFLTLDPGPPPSIVLVTQQDETSSSGPIATASVQKAFEDLRTRLDYARRVSPSIRGSQQLEDDIMLALDRDLSREWRLGFRGGYNMRSAEGEDVAVGLNRFRVDDLNRDQAMVSGNLSYRFTSEISLRADYRFSYNTFTNERQDSVYNHSFFVTLSYDGEPRFLRGY
jgi:hypothetical protein